VGYSGLIVKRLLVVVSICSSLVALLTGACVSARLVAHGTGGQGAGGSAGGSGGDGGGECFDPVFLHRDFVAVVGQPETAFGFAVFLRLVWDEQRGGHAMHPLCFQDHWTDLGEHGFVRLNIEPNGDVEGVFDQVPYVEGLGNGGAGGGTLYGDVLVPAKATPPLVPRPVLMDLTITGNLCSVDTSAGTFCTTIAGEVLAPPVFANIALDPSEIIFLSNVDDPADLVFSCDAKPVPAATEPCPACVATECQDGTPFDETCNQCLMQACASEPSCNCSIWDSACTTAAQASCGCVSN
jgi:hypothetical protein